MKLIFRIFGYGIGTLFILTGLIAPFVYDTGKIAGLFYFIAGISILPPTIEGLKKAVRNYSPIYSVLLFLVCFVVAGITAPQTEGNENSTELPQSSKDTQSRGESPKDVQVNNITENKEEVTKIIQPVDYKDKDTNIVDTTPIEKESDLNQNSRNEQAAVDMISLVKRTVGNNSNTIEEIYNDEIDIPAVIGYGWASVKNPKGEGWYVGYKTDMSGSESLPVWWIKDDHTVYWVNGKASARTGKTIQQIPYNASGMSVSDIFTLMSSQEYSE